MHNILASQHVLLWNWPETDVTYLIFFSFEMMWNLIITKIRRSRSHKMNITSAEIFHLKVAIFDQII